MIGLITDRTQSNVDRLKALAQKGWINMTAAEQAEWSGDPLLVDGGANLLPRGENYGDGTSVKYHNDTIRVLSNWAGTYIYAVLAVGPAESYAGKTMTLSLDDLYHPLYQTELSSFPPFPRQTSMRSFAACLVWNPLTKTMIMYNYFKSGTAIFTIKRALADITAIMRLSDVY